MKKPVSFLLAAFLLLQLCIPSVALDHPGLTENRTAPGRFTLIRGGVPPPWSRTRPTSPAS